MHIKRVALQNFRNIRAADLELGAGVNVLYGDNAQGKTNFLEAVYFCATGRSHRAGRDRELVMMSEKEACARVIVQGRGIDDEIKMQIRRDGKTCWVDGVPIRRLGELYGRLDCVIFSPEDLALVKAGPGVRRRFMDMELCQLYPAYYHNLRMYYKVLKQRNNLLKELFLGKKLLDTLVLWDEQLADYGGRIIVQRSRFVEALSELAMKNQRSITAGKEGLELVYRCNTGQEEFTDKLNKYRSMDIARGTTSVGIHKDDMEFRIDGSDGRNFASQGQQRTAALAVKLAEIEFVREVRGHSPVLLLDDVLSELDRGRQNYLMGAVEGLQVIITLTGAEGAFGVEGVRVFRVEEGVLRIEN